MTTRLQLAAALGAALIILSSWACNDDGGNNPPNSKASFVSSGVMKKGSIILNGVRFDDGAANIIIDDNPGEPAVKLEDGMFVTVAGRLDDNGTDGVADRVEVENEVRGKITALEPPDAFLVLGQRVFVDRTTIFDGVTGYSTLTTGAVVEVHGLRDAAGMIRAARIEVVGAEAADELRGTIANYDAAAKTFDLFTTQVSYASATIEPAGATLANGVFVEVHGSFAAVFEATRVDLEDREDEALEPAEGARVHLEGYITGFTAHPGVFAVAGMPVESKAVTRFERGTPLDLANDVKIEVEGFLKNDVLVADKIELKDAVRMEANIEAIDLGAFTFVLMGKTVFVTSATELDPSFAELAIGDGVRFRGFLNPDDTTMTATRVSRESNPIEADRFIVQGLVVSFNAGARALVVAGVAIDASSNEMEFRAKDETVMTASGFFSALETSRLVKARGTFTGGTLVADELQLE